MVSPGRQFDADNAQGARELRVATRPNKTAPVRARSVRRRLFPDHHIVGVTGHHIAGSPRHLYGDAL
jgi:hypothetical protein